jgi:hypothetical protein
LVAYNSPPFTAFRGFSGGNNLWLQTAPFSGAGRKMQQGDESLGVWVDVGQSDGQNSVVIGTTITGTSSNRFINAQQVGNKVSWRMNTSATRSGDATNAYQFRNGDLDDSVVVGFADNPQALTTLYLTVGRAGTAYSTRRHSIVFYGAGLTALENAVLFNTLGDYMRAVGAA